MRNELRRASVVMSLLLAIGVSAAAAPTERLTKDRETGSRPRALADGFVAQAQPARLRPVAAGPSAKFLVESNSISFGDVLPGLPAFVPTAMVVRVFSERPWTLRLVPTTALTIHERGETISLSRLEWRSSRRGGFVRFQEGAPVSVASGSATTAAGELVTIDLRLTIRDEDPLGSYGCSFRVELDPTP